MLRAVRGEGELRQALHERVDGDLAFDAREGGAEAEVDAPAEGDVAIVGARDVQAVGIGKLSRVSAVHSLFTGTSNQLGAFGSGLTAALFGTVPSVLIGGIGTIAVAALWMVLFPQLRRLHAFEEH